jgi:hypothetical protein
VCTIYVFADFTELKTPEIVNEEIIPIPHPAKV